MRFVGTRRKIINIVSLLIATMVTSRWLIHIK
jgi:hypothetical protein